MTINVEALIYSLGKSYREMMDTGLIPYLTEPKGASGSPMIDIDMKKEGVLLAFKRNGRVLQEIDLIIERDDIKNWTFPNKLPSPLQKTMSREWVHNTFGSPDKSIPPREVMKIFIGWADRFTIEGFHIPITMQMRYDMNSMVKTIAFLPTSELRW